jgi:hypothetical protein
MSGTKAQLKLVDVSPPGISEGDLTRRGVSWTIRDHQSQFARLIMRLVIFLLALGLVALVMAIAEPVGTAIQIGPDEHYEVIKGLLCAKGFLLYRQVWNDQPPLHTVLLGLCFKSFGGTISVARALAVAFGLSLLTACGVLVARRSGVLAALLVTTCLFTAPQVLELSVSVMLEVPAIGTAVWALWPILKWREDSNWRWLALSGGMLAAALQIKPTAAVVAPALAAEILLGTQGLPRANQVRETARALGIWCTCMAGAYLGLAAALGTVPPDVLWGSHFSTRTLAHAAGSPSVPFWSCLRVDHVDAIWTAAAGVFLLICRRAWNQLTFPLVWLCTVTIFHLHHRPWWPCYYLHFAVPLAWLSGCGIAELFQIAWAKDAERTWRARFLTFGRLGAASLLLATVTAYGGRRLVSDVESIRELPRAHESRLLAKMRQYAARTRWVYTQETVYPFHAGLIVVPELAVLPRKRFWSGQITNEQIWATIKRLLSAPS